MNRIASIPTPSAFSARTPQRQPSLISLSQKPDQVLFGKGQKDKKDKHEKHDHHHGHDCKGEKKSNWFSKRYQTVKHWFKSKKADKKTNACNDNHCEKPHDHDHPHHDHSHGGNWLERQYHAVKTWLKNVKEHICEDLTNLYNWLGKKFPNVFKHSPRP